MEDDSGPMLTPAADSAPPFAAVGHAAPIHPLPCAAEPVDHSAMHMLDNREGGSDQAAACAAAEAAASAEANVAPASASSSSSSPLSVSPAPAAAVADPTPASPAPSDSPPTAAGGRVRMRRAASSHVRRVLRALGASARLERALRDSALKFALAAGAPPPPPSDSEGEGRIVFSPSSSQRFFHAHEETDRLYESHEAASQAAAAAEAATATDSTSVQAAESDMSNGPADSLPPAAADAAPESSAQSADAAAPQPTSAPSSPSPPTASRPAAPLRSILKKRSFESIQAQYAQLFQQTQDVSGVKKHRGAAALAQAQAQAHSHAHAHPSCVAERSMLCTTSASSMSVSYVEHSTVTLHPNDGGFPYGMPLPMPLLQPERVAAAAAAYAPHLLPSHPPSPHFLHPHVAMPMHAIFPCPEMAVAAAAAAAAAASLADHNKSVAACAPPMLAPALTTVEESS